MPSPISSKSIVTVKDYQFSENGNIDNRYFIIIDNENDISITFNTVTKNARGGKYFSLNKGSNIEVGGFDVDIFYFPKKYELCTNSFSFPLDSYIHSDSIFIKPVDDFLRKYGDKLEVQGIIKDSELNDLVYHFYISEHTPNKYKPLLEKILENLN